MSTTISYGLGILAAYISTHVVQHHPYANWGDLLYVFVVWLTIDIIWFVLKVVVAVLRD